MDKDRIALQLYTVRDRTSQDFVGTLRQVSEIGYKAVEFAGYGGVPVEELRRTLDELGLRAVAAHTPFEQLTQKTDQTLEELHLLGCEYAVVPAVREDLRDSVEKVRALAQEFNRIGQMCRADGLAFAYHNHSFEFRQLDGATMYETLAAETDPALVQLELDVYWAQYGGFDPIDLAIRYSGRLPLIHVKDMSAGDNPTDVPVGEGVLPWDRILSACAQAGAQWYIVEMDNPRDSIEDVRTSLRNLEAMPDPQPV